MSVSQAPRNPAGPSPLRHPNSVRRTTSIDSDWPYGRGQPSRVHGIGRDLLTLPDGRARVLAEDRVEGTVSMMREILALECAPPRAGTTELVGRRAGGHLRAALDEALPRERDAGSPLYLMLDDLSGATLVAGWAWSRWDPNWLKQIKAAGASTAGRNGQMEGVCVGFAPGSSALGADGASSPDQSSASVPPLENPADPLGWHLLAAQEGVAMRRARRIDVWREAGAICIDAGFQDSATSPKGGRVAVHEYRLTALADAKSGRLTAVEADPRILPYRECPAAVRNLSRLIGAPLSGLRWTVLRELRGTQGCTHLNDALRALAEVPQLLAHVGAPS